MTKFYEYLDKKLYIKSNQLKRERSHSKSIAEPAIMHKLKSSGTLLT
jgi:hypothetical protein